jgi:hypothetical protein
MRACLLLVALAGLVATTVWFTPLRATSGRPDRAAAASPARSSGATALAILHAWDADRARAYGAGRPGRLRELYVPGSSAGRADVELLRRYHRRGLSVTGMRTQVLAVAVLEHRAGRWRLHVTDRLVGAVAVGRGGRLTLPRDRPSVHDITLMRAGQEWRVDGVLEAGWDR